VEQPVSRAEFEQLAAEVRYLRDREDILDAMVRYTRGADRLDRDLLISAYHEDATDDRGAFTGHREARAEWLFKFLETLGGTSHHISNFAIEIDGDVAHAESYVITTSWPQDESTATIGGARYLDRLERRAGKWAIAHRESVMDFNFTVPTADLPPAVLKGRRDRSDRSYVRPLGLSPEAQQRLAAGGR
jgi:hypothetical protein